MQKNGYERSQYNVCVCIKKLHSADYVYMLLYVDNILVVLKDKKQVNDLKVLLNSEFDMKDLGDARKILGMEITRDRAKVP